MSKDTGLICSRVENPGCQVAQICFWSFRYVDITRVGESQRDIHCRRTSGGQSLFAKEFGKALKTSWLTTTYTHLPHPFNFTSEQIASSLLFYINYKAIQPLEELSAREAQYVIITILIIILFFFNGAFSLWPLNTTSGWLGFWYLISFDRKWAVLVQYLE